jgi:hypothetical protein
MTEYVIKKVSQSLWMVFADQKSVGACADESEALKFMAEHSAANNASKPGALGIRPLGKGCLRTS